jgi:carbon-monoxide dehydrogenase medium subunit
MKPAPFEYVRAESPEQAVALLATHGGDARLLAGGQSLIPMMNLRLARPAILVDIGRLPLTKIAAGPGSIAIGALARHCDLLASSAIASITPIIPAAMHHVAHPTIRNYGTAGGSVAYADPTAEIPSLLVLLDGEIITRSPKGTRTIAAGDFFRSAFDTALAEDEMIVELRLRPPASRHGSCFLEISERHGDYAIAAVGVTVLVDDGFVKEARIVLSGAESRPVRAREAEGGLVGHRIDAVTARAAASAAIADRSPYSDIRATSAYRKSLLETLTARALEQAWRSAA